MTDPMYSRALTRCTVQILLIALLSSQFSVARADDDPQKAASQDLTKLSIEDLMKLEVTTASKSARPLSSVPAAIFVLTQEDIQRAGVNNIPDALRLVPGVEVAQIDAGKWAISIRGFNSRFANKLLVLVDGRSVYTPFFSGVFWDAQDTLIQDIERIEVVRGPGGSLWGANAVNGVINIITTHTKNTRGQMFSAEGGEVRKSDIAYRYGGNVSNNATYRIFAKYFSERDSLYPDGTRGKDGWDSLRGGFRVDWDPSDGDKVLFTGELHGDNQGQRSLTPLLGPPYMQVSDDKNSVSGWHLLGRWTRQAARGAESSLQVYFDRTQREAVEIDEVRNTFDLDFQHRLSLNSRWTITGGAGYRVTADKTHTTAVSSLVPPSKTDELFSTFLQAEARVTPTVNLVLGSRLEHNDYTGFEFQPNARLSWSPSDHRTLWASISRAVRTPSRGEPTATIDLAAQPGPGGIAILSQLQPSSTFGSEHVTAYELGYRFGIGRTAMIDLAAFYNEYNNLASFEIGAPALQPAPIPHLVVPLTANNLLYGRTHGFEMAVRWNASRSLSAGITYTYYEENLALNPASTAQGVPLSTTPRHQVSLNLWHDMGRGVQADAWGSFVGAIPGGFVPQYVRVDARVAWKPSARLEASVGARNLLGSPHVEFQHMLFEMPIEVERSVYGKLSWRY